MTQETELKDLWNYFVGGTFDINEDYDKSFEYAKKLGLFSHKTKKLKSQLEAMREYLNCKGVPDDLSEYISNQYYQYESESEEHVNDIVANVLSFLSELLQKEGKE